MSTRPTPPPDLRDLDEMIAKLRRPWRRPHPDVMVFEARRSDDENGAPYGPLVPVMVQPGRAHWLDEGMDEMDDRRDLDATPSPTAGGHCPGCDGEVDIGQMSGRGDPCPGLSPTASATGDELREALLFVQHVMDTEHHWAMMSDARGRASGMVAQLLAATPTASPTAGAPCPFCGGSGLRDDATGRSATPTASPTAICPACGGVAQGHDWWPVGDDSYACEPDTQ